MRYPVRALFEDDPDSIRGFYELNAGISKGEWIYRSDSKQALEKLGLDEGCYSDAKPSIVLHKDDYCPGLSYPNCMREDEDLHSFLLYSINKHDILKPFGHNNLRSSREAKYYIIQDATVICTRLSIAVLDSEGRIVKECSHNAAECLLIWLMSFRGETVHQEKAVLASVQQTFNLGHWLIDVIPRIWLAYVGDESLARFSKGATLLVDSGEHPIAKKTLNHLEIHNVQSTLPITVWKVRRLVVPLVTSFHARTLISSKLVKQVYEVKQKQKGGVLSKRVYLSRQRQARRRIMNHVDVEEILQRFGFTTVYPEELSLKEMHSIMDTAEIVCGPNGAAMCNTLFRSGNACKTAIIYPQGHIDDYYFRVSSDLGHHFFGMKNDTTQKRKSLEEMIHTYYYPELCGDYAVNCMKLKVFLEWVIS